MSDTDLDETGTEKEKLWIYGVVKRVSDDTCLVSKNARTKCHMVGEAAEILWDAVPSINFPLGTSIKKFNPHLWNKDKVGAWCVDVEKIDYGLK